LSQCHGSVEVAIHLDGYEENFFFDIVLDTTIRNYDILEWMRAAVEWDEMSSMRCQRQRLTESMGLSKFEGLNKDRVIYNSQGNALQ